MTRSLAYNTSRINYTDKRRCYTLCPYCGKEMRRIESQEYEEVYFNCDCPDANKEHELDLKIDALRRQYPKKRFSVEVRSLLIDNQKKKNE